MDEVSPDLVFTALQRAVVASGATLQGADVRTRTVFFKRGRKNESVSVRTGPQGPYLVGPSAMQLDQLVRAEIGKTPQPSRGPGLRDYDS